METKTIGDRVYLIRKHNELTQTEFARKLGLTHATISATESGKVPLTEANLRLISLTFNVNEEWLRFGEGDMFDIDNNDPLISEVVELMKKMSPEERQVVLNYVRWYASQQQTLTGKEAPPEKGEEAADLADDDFPLEPIRPDSDPSDFIEKKRIG